MITENSALLTSQSKYIGTIHFLRLLKPRDLTCNVITSISALKARGLLRHIASVRAFAAISVVNGKRKKKKRSLRLVKSHAILVAESASLIKKFLI